MKPVFFEKAKKNPSWIQFKDFYKREVEALLRKGNKMEKLFNQTSILLQDEELKSHELSILNEVKKSKILQKDSPFYQLLDARSKLKSFKDESFERLLTLSKTIFPESLKPKVKSKKNQAGSNVSHSSYVNEPFGYSIFQAVDYGKIPILNRDWCKDIEYPFRSYSKEEFEKQVKTIKGVSYQERNDILENLRNELNNRYNNPKIWANQYLSIYNRED